MKSIMEEASSIIKAIEKGWARAGNPKEFTVKVFEEPEKNFFGITTRSAKIGIFFADAKPVKQEPVVTKQKLAQKPAPAQIQTKVREQKQRPLPKEKIKEQKPSQVEAREEGQEVVSRPPVWTDEMQGTVRQWLTEFLALVNMPVTFTLNPQHFHLKINFSNKIYDDKNREKQLFSSLATLMLNILKYQNKRPLKGYKIIFIGGGQ